MTTIQTSDNLRHTTTLLTALIKRQTSINFVKYPSKVPWCSDFLYDNFKRYSQHTIKTIHSSETGKAAVAEITHFAHTITEIIGRI
jgi:hypothetical protein